MYIYIYVYIYIHHSIYNIQFVFAPPNHPLDSHPSCLQVGQEMLGLQAAAEFTLDLITASTGSLQMSGQGGKKNG